MVPSLNVAHPPRDGATRPRSSFVFAVIFDHALDEGAPRAALGTYLFLRPPTPPDRFIKLFVSSSRFSFHLCAREAPFRFVIFFLESFLPRIFVRRLGMLPRGKYLVLSFRRGCLENRKAAPGLPQREIK